MSSSASFSQPAAALISPALEKYLTTCTPAELETILNVIQAMCKKSSVLNMSNIKHKVTKPKKIAKFNNTKRPLNSWMAFRAYYSPIFVAQQQKDISGLMTRLWKADPFHAKWAILAKAYSVIRDYKATAQTELDSFLSICCPHIGIVSPEDYLDMLGWEFKSVGGTKTLVRNFTPSVCDFNDELQKATLSVEDIISFCHEVGHVDTDDIKRLGGNSSLTMAAPISSTTGNISEASQTFQFTIETPTSSNASHSTFATPSISPFPGYMPATDANSSGLGIFQPNTFNEAAFPAYHLTHNGPAPNANLSWPAHPTEPFSDSYGIASGFNQTHTFEPLVQGNFQAFDIRDFTEAEFGYFDKVFNENDFVDFDFDGKAT